MKNFDIRLYDSHYKESRPAKNDPFRSSERLSVTPVANWLRSARAVQYPVWTSFRYEVAVLESLQKLLPWIIGLPTIPKILITAMWTLLSITFLYLMWIPSPDKTPPKPADVPAVKEAYSRMVRTLARLKRSPDGHILVDGFQIEHQLTPYYVDYVAIEEFIVAHPNDIPGAYETIWEHGGGGRGYINDTQSFEAVVGQFFNEYKDAHDAGNLAPERK